MTFTLHPQLAADTVPLGDLGLSRLLLMNDARYPWLVLVPRRPDLVEIVDLAAAERAELMEEIARCSEALMRLLTPTKLNVAAVGNRVAQLHVHLVARFETDASWPEPVWGRGAPLRYGAGARQERVSAMSSALGLV